MIRVHLDKPGRAFTGSYGLNDQGGANGRATFRIRDNDGEILLESGEIRSGESARPFSVVLGGRTDLLLEVHKVDSIDHTHGDWFDLTVTPP